MAHFGLIAGHGGSDPGAVSGKRYEKDDNLKFCLAVGEMLEDRGHRISYYRKDDSACPAHLSKKWIKETDADFFLCFHRNAYNGKAFGVESWTFSDDLSIGVGNTLAQRIAMEGGFYNRGRKSGGAAWINSEKPCCQLEIGFIDNENDNDLFDDNYYSIVCAVCDGLEVFFERCETSELTKATATDALNIRREPSLTASILGAIPKGEKCIVYSVENGWASVNYNGFKGYSCTDYLIIEEKPEEDAEEVAVEEATDEPSYNFLLRAFLKLSELIKTKIGGE